jgi:hypothetical protein
VSRASIRQQIYTYLNGASIANVAFYPAMPKETDPFPATAGVSTTAIAFPVVAQQEELRLGFGKKEVRYSITLEIAAFSAQAKGEDAQADCDAIFEGILAAIRADPTLGTQGSTTLLQAGEGTGMGSQDLRVDQDMPVLSDDGAGVHIWAHMAITAIEVITA